MQLGKAKAFGMFDDHDAGFGDIHPDLDNSGGHKQLRTAITKAVHRRITRITLHLAMRQRHFDVGQGAGQRGCTFLGSGHIQLFGFLNKRTYPVGPFPAGNCTAKPRYHITKPVKRHGARIDRQAASRFFIKA